MGNLSPAAQSKLLTALEKRRIVRLGGTREIPIDVRLICATNADLHAQVTEGTFRQDLFYRINTVEIHIPPLRERGEDIQLLADHFLRTYARKYKKDIRQIARDASPSPESEIKIHLRRNTAEDEVQISVQDYGQGIPVEAQERIFVPFYTTKPNGSGIGLALCKQIVNQHHGYITLHSTVGKGSLFTLCLPRNGLRAPQT